MTGYEKRGYLNSDFKLFHITDTKQQDFEYHYHDFSKIIIFIRGHVTYRIEGRAYELEPYDIILVGPGDIHKPDITPDVPYERIIVYLSPNFLDSYRSSPEELPPSPSFGDGYDLSDCFKKAREEHSGVLRIQSMEKSGLFQTITDLEYACSHDGYAKELYCQVVFLEFMIKLNRAVLTGRVDYIAPQPEDRRVGAIMDYIGSHLTEELSVDRIAESVYVSRYHLMHLFKEATGYTVGSYITEKRLLLARDLLKKGTSLTAACFDCGFKNYSTFSRAYRKQFGVSPSSHASGSQVYQY